MLPKTIFHLLPKRKYGESYMQTPTSYKNSKEPNLAIVSQTLQNRSLEILLLYFSKHFRYHIVPIKLCVFKLSPYKKCHEVMSRYCQLPIRSSILGRESKFPYQIPANVSFYLVARGKRLTVFGIITYKNPQKQELH